MSKEASPSVLFCVCQRPWSDGSFYIGCDVCSDWLHGSCVGILPTEAARVDKYICPRCRKRNEEVAPPLTVSFGRAGSKLSLRNKKRPLENGTAEQLPMNQKDEQYLSCLPRVVGLPNVDGTLCWLNALLQAIFHCVAASPTIDLKSFLPADTEASLELKSVLSCMKTANDTLQSAKKLTQALDFSHPHGLPLARSLRREFPGCFAIGEQHDVSEAFLALLGECRHFRGSIRSTVRCCCCNTLKTAEETYVTLDVSRDSVKEESTELPEPFLGRPDSVKSAINRLWQPELLEGSERVYCSRCAERTDSWRHVSPLAIPELLVVLVRPSASQEFGSSRVVKRPLDSRERFHVDEELCCSDIFGTTSEEGGLYRLSAVVLHTGSAFSSGHYTTAVTLEAGKAPPHSNPRNESWALLDDLRPSWVAEDEARRFLGKEAPPFETAGAGFSEKSSTPYLLFYTRGTFV